MGREFQCRCRDPSQNPLPATLSCNSAAGRSALRGVTCTCLKRPWGSLLVAPLHVPLLVSYALMFFHVPLFALLGWPSLNQITTPTRNLHRSTPRCLCFQSIGSVPLGRLFGGKLFFQGCAAIMNSGEPCDQLNCVSATCVQVCAHAMHKISRLGVVLLDCQNVCKSMPGNLNKVNCVALFIMTTASFNLNMVYCMLRMRWSLIIWTSLTALRGTGCSLKRRNPSSYKLWIETSDLPS